MPRPKGDEFERFTNYLFSDQCALSYGGRIENKYANFFELLMYEVISKNDYHEYHRWEINWLIEHKYIQLDSEKYIRMCNIKHIYILKDLYCSERID